MPLRISPICRILIPLLGFAIASPANATEDPIEVIEVTGHLENASVASALETSPTSIDISNILNKLPGAAVNSNGPLTGIAQYRGMFGDRVNTKVNGLSVSGAGPNAMDTPLSYASLILTEQVEMSRGIAPISAGTDTLGGNVQVIESQARFDETSGVARGQYQDNGKRSYLGAKANIANKQHAFMIYGDKLKGTDNTEASDGREISPGEYDKMIVGGQYRFALDDMGEESLAISYQHLETLDAGTPALPMDIDYIRTDRVKLEGEHLLTQWQMDWNLAYSDARHGMDNFSLRFKPATRASRYNTADSTALSGAVNFEKNAWLMGFEFQQDEHKSLITDPTNPMFMVDNFNDVDDESYSGFIQWQQDVNEWNWQIGGRVKHYRTDASTVNHSMAANSAAIKMLMDAYNNADRSQSQTGIDIALNGQYQFNQEVSAVVGIARKQAAASYQQRYLWVPMQSTGGMADGRTYVGKMELDLETAYQLELGVNYHSERLSLSPRIFVHQIEDYIQGVTATNPAVIMAAAMMGDENPLEFANTEARLFGMDVQGAYQLNPRWNIDFMAAYINGERTDIDDDLYRIAPPRATVGVNYQSETWFARLESVAVAAQNKVSSSSLEQATAGYGLVNLSFGYDIQNWQLKAGINNLLDKDYKDHLGAYNRVMMSNIEPGERMPGQGLNTWITGEYRF